MKTDLEVARDQVLAARGNPERRSGLKQRTGERHRRRVEVADELTEALVKEMAKLTF